MRLYRHVLWPLLRRIPPERAHFLAARTMGLLTRPAVMRRLVRRLAGAPDPRLEVEALGRTFPSPLGAAAGMDKDASWYEALGVLGFGFVEVGTTTASAQAGNPGTRVARLVRDSALVNALGFPNAGAVETAQRLAGSSGETIVGVNVGKSRDRPLEDADADYVSTVRRLAGDCAYVVVNVSSPNTPGLRDMQSVERMRPLLVAIKGELAAQPAPPPLLVKIAPDLEDAEIDAIADLALELRLDGIVAVNTTVSRTSVTECAALHEVEGGGISGRPLKRRAVEVLERLRARVGDRLLLVSVGGIETAEDALERILAGATLVQAYTAFVYHGPAWPSRINSELAEMVGSRGAATIGELIGAGRGAPAGHI